MRPKTLTHPPSLSREDPLSQSQFQFTYSHADRLANRPRGNIQDLGK